MARILVAEDDEQMRVAITIALRKGGHDIVVVGDGEAALEQLGVGSFDLLLTDDRMTPMTGMELIEALARRSTLLPTIVITAYGTVDRAVAAMQRGAADFIMKPFAADDLLRVVERVLGSGTKSVAVKHKGQARERPIITADPKMIRLIEVAEAVARSDVSVLIQGESGTGKELIARLIHFSSPRRHHPFVAVNCAALPLNLLESELFGHEKGAFTGAQHRKIGKFELAHGGTILLDEVSEMDIVLQAKLLRVLQEREVDRVGGGSPVPIDVRVIATTNRDLERMVTEGRFRFDLYHRLNVIPLVVPPLRERRGDVRLLVEHFARIYCDGAKPDIDEEVLEALERYQWPGNVRELQNAVQRAAVLSSGGMPREGDFLLPAGANDIVLARGATGDEGQPPCVEIANSPAAEPSDRLRLRCGMTVEEAERLLIFETLRATGNNRTKAAKLLGISIRTLRNKLHEYRQRGASSSWIVE